MEEIKETRGRKKLPAELKRDIKVHFKFNQFEKERFDGLMSESKIILKNWTKELEILKTAEKKASLKRNCKRRYSGITKARRSQENRGEYTHR